MLIELGRAGLQADEESPITVYYDEYVFGKFSADLYVEETILVELKSVKNTVRDHEVQLVNYLKGTRKDIGLLINFGPSGVEVKRKYREFAKS